MSKAIFGETKYPKSRLAAIWDTSEGGWYFRADQHEGTYESYRDWDIDDPNEDDENLIHGARQYAIYCGVSPAGDVEIIGRP